MPFRTDNPPATADTTLDWLALLQDQVGDLKFGVVQVVVHDGKVTQLERTEKFRLQPSSRD